MRQPTRQSNATAVAPQLALIYCRVSTKEQVDGHSLETQQRVCREHCEKLGFSVVQVFVESGESAKTANRTQLVKMLQFCRTAKPRINFVVVHKLDRLARNSVDHHAIRNMLATTGTGLISATEPVESTPAGRFLEGLLAGMAQFDNEVKAERTVAGMQQANLNGRYTWPAPLGYSNSRDRSSPSLQPDEMAPFVTRAFELAASGNLSKAEILRILNASGFRTKRRKPVSLQTFNQLLQKRVYLARITAVKWQTESVGDWKPLVLEHDFNRVQARHFGRGTKSRRLKEHPDFPLRRFVRCAACSKPLTGSNSRGRGGKGYPYYHCAKCNRIRSRKEDLEVSFVQLLSGFEVKPQYLALFRAIVIDAWKTQRSNLIKTRDALERSLGAIQKRIDQLEQRFIFESSIDQETYANQLERLRRERASAECELGNARFEELEVETLLAFAEHLLGNLASAWSQAAPKDKRQLQEAMFPTGLSWNGDSFGNAVTIPAFNWLRGVLQDQSSLASPTGFEPVF